ncbi:von Willebrand factor type A [Reticulomyxa filosa]|uniref:von Willebrand factor type A n=1 Tax=Reticulomyxa filosa TaxID=46433 RepID=X6NER5_RETFI|nr:von Willebrand factor type A [Reticulomyxa filosa]|eukprot:ETO24466.1 von Willebrand factor type A [Reticulomyxa filosa]
MAISFGTKHYVEKETFALKVTDFEHEGIFGRYYFDTSNEVGHEPSSSQREEKTKEASSEKSHNVDHHLSIRTNYAQCRDPLSNEMQQWLGIGLHSIYDGKAAIKKYGRPAVRLVVVLDVSGSMDLTLEGGEGVGTQSKIVVAKQSLLSMLKNLKDNDWLSIITFDEHAHLIHPLTQWKHTNAESLKQQIASIKAEGGTDLSVAFRAAGAVLREELKKNQTTETPTHAENRILFFTDMQPTRGELSEGGLFALASGCSEEHIYTTFVGVGQDFGTDLTQHITTNLRGGQYMTIQNAHEFEELMTENFDYSVFPIAFDLVCEIGDGCAFEIEHVYGTREPSGSTLMSVKTLFPSHVNEDGITKGCMILLKLKPNKNALSKGDKTTDVLKLKWSYESAISGKSYSETTVATFGEHDSEKEYFQTTGVHKAIVLTKYVNLCRALVSKYTFDFSLGIPDSVKTDKQKIVNPNHKTNTGEKLQSPLEAAETFSDHYKNMSDILRDASMKEELVVLDKIISHLKKKQKN